MERKVFNLEESSGTFSGIADAVAEDIASLMQEMVEIERNEKIVWPGNATV
jgi:hypothetical protein